MITTSLIALLLSFECGIAFIMPPSAFATRTISTSWTPTSLLASISLKDKPEPFDHKNRFHRIASSEAAINAPCVLTIQGKSYNMTAWAKSHPGGNTILEKFHNKDATKAFFAAGHSQHAIDMLSNFLIDDTPFTLCAETLANAMATVGVSSATQKGPISRARTKLFTKEDRFGLHKYCGIFVLLHFAYRFLQSFFGDPAAGMGNIMGKESSFISLACLIPHTVLSLSSLIFQTVPRERIVGRPMIVSNEVFVRMKALHLSI